MWGLRLDQHGPRTADAHRLGLVRRAADPAALAGVVLEEPALSGQRYTCCDDRRLRAVEEAGVLNGIEYVEVYDSEAPPGLRQLALLVRLLAPAPGLTPETNVEIIGGERIRTVADPPRRP